MDATERRDALRKRRLMLGLGVVAPIVIVTIVIVLLIRTFAGGPAGPSAPGAAAADAAELMDRARQRLKQGEPAQAEAILRTAAEVDAANQDVHTLYAETLLALDRPKDAYRHYEQAIAIGPDNAELRFAAGAVASLSGMLDRAEEHYSRAQQLAPTNPKHPLYLGQVLRRMKRIDEAKASLLRAANLDPNLALAWGMLASIELDENNLSVARGFVKRARESEPTALAWRLIEAKILRRENKPEDAVRLLMALDERDRLTDPTVLEELGLCYGLLKRPGDAAEMYARAVEKSPNDADLLRQAAEWHKRAGLNDEAKSFADRAAAARAGATRAAEDTGK